MLPLIATLALQTPVLPVDGATFSGHIVKKAQINYLIAIPEDYDPKARKRYPLLMFLHGSGERGNDLEALRRHGPPKEIAKGRKFPFIVISPQCTDGHGWDSDVLVAVIKQVERQYRIDRDREYLTGLSMGGYGTWALAIAEPKRFAAIAPISGGGNPKDVPVLKDIPTWVTHGDSDPVVPIASDQAMVDALRAAGGDVRFDVIKGGGHDVWTPVYESDDLYAWFLTKKRKK